MIAIIGVLASVVLASLNSAREKSRNAARLAQAQEFIKALELYYADNGDYPCANAGNCGDRSVENLNPDTAAGGELISSGYINTIPEDPTFSTNSGGTGCNSADATGYCYCSAPAHSSTPGSYILTIELEGQQRCNIQRGSNTALLCSGHVGVTSGPCEEI